MRVCKIRDSDLTKYSKLIRFDINLSLPHFKSILDIF